MRPAQNARDNYLRNVRAGTFTRASMRPAQNARDNRIIIGVEDVDACASMRPAQNARDNPFTLNFIPAEHTRFNEARAKRTG